MFECPTFAVLTAAIHWGPNSEPDICPNIAAQRNR